jgi:hypothetical protein
MGCTSGKPKKARASSGVHSTFMVTFISNDPFPSHPSGGHGFPRQQCSRAVTQS